MPSPSYLERKEKARPKSCNSKYVGMYIGRRYHISLDPGKDGIGLADSLTTSATKLHFVLRLMRPKLAEDKTLVTKAPQ